MASAHPFVVTLDLDQTACTEPERVGAKAANLARAATASVPVLPGFAIVTTAGTGPDGDAPLRNAWERLSEGGRLAVVVRSSSTIEDIGESSMAGQFRSVIDVRGWDAFCAAVAEVRASAARPDGSEPMAMGVLVQRHLDAAIGGVAFGVDPVSGDPDHFLVEAVQGGPDRLVSGEVTATRYLLSHHGRVAEVDAEQDPPLLDTHRRRELAALVRRVEEVFGGSQDIEWAFDEDGGLWLLQSRPVTATGQRATAHGPLLGPGPVAETFPEALRPLEEDLWIEPLRAGIERAIRMSGAVSRHRIEASPIVTTVGGRVAADLELFGYRTQRRSGWALLDPRPGGRRLLAAGRVGRFRAALPARVAEVLADTDQALADVPALDELDDAQLVGLLARCRELLQALHGFEVLAGTLLPDEDRPSGAAVALQRLAAARATGARDDAIRVAHPVVLALVPPRVGAPRSLPPTPVGGRPPTTERVVGAMATRDALRLRSRWVQELSARAATALGERCRARGLLAHPELVAFLRLTELAGLIDGDEVPADLAGRAEVPPGPPLPAVFRRTAEGGIAPVVPRHGTGSADDHGGRGASGGRCTGRVVHTAGDAGAHPGSVLVVRTLDPDLAAVLPSLAGIVAETGGALSHLAILAREYRVPAVVAVPEAVQRFPRGTTVLVDGDTGEVRRLDESAET
ncbi:MAG: PEP-utilizing enzyme [Acidimicrobiales bacterium]|nr:PEP-utilizing enzyme [Acidimicrobiales bacterium]